MATPNEVAPSAFRTSPSRKAGEVYEFEVWLKGEKCFVSATAERVGAREEGMFVSTYEVYAENGTRRIRLEFDRQVADYVEQRVNDAFWQSCESDGREYKGHDY